MRIFSTRATMLEVTELLPLTTQHSSNERKASIRKLSQNSLSLRIINGPRRS